MATDIKDKAELASLASKLNIEIGNLLTDIEGVKGALGDIEDYDRLTVSSAASTIRSNINNVFDDADVVSRNISNYVTLMTGIDVDDFSATALSTTGTIDYEDLFESDGTAHGNARVIWNFLKYKGLSDAAAAGVLGNIQAESGFNPGIQEYATGEGYGLIQWSFSRRDSLEAAAAARGVDVSDLQFQLEYLWEESLDPSTSYGKNLAAAGFYTTTSASDAAYYFHKYVEISADSQAAIQNNRCATAEKWYSEFSGTDAGAVSGAEENNGDWINAIVTTVPAAATVVKSTGTRYTTTSSSVHYSSGPSYSSSSGGYSGGYQKVSTTPVTITSGDPNIDVSKYKNNLEAGFEVTVGNLAYELSEEDIELLCAIVAAESDKSYDDALAVITTILNRCEHPDWINSHGTDPIAQATAPNQFVVFQHGSYKTYMDGKAPDTVKEAVMDALAGVRNHEYLSFRSNGTTSYSDNMISPTGNRYK